MLSAEAVTHKTKKVTLDKRYKSLYDIQAPAGADS